jgi:hypothetical protein
MQARISGHCRGLETVPLKINELKAALSFKIKISLPPKLYLNSKEWGSIITKFKIARTPVLLSDQNLQQINEVRAISRGRPENIMFVFVDLIQYGWVSDGNKIYYTDALIFQEMAYRGESDVAGS